MILYSHYSVKGTH